MAKYLPLPDGSSLEVPDSMSLNEAMSRAKEAFPELYAPKDQGAGPQGGFMASLKAGTSGLKSDVAALAGKAGLMDEDAAQKYIDEQKAYQAKTFKPTEAGWTDKPFTKTAELLGGSLPYMAAPVVAGALAPEGAAALGATGLASLAQFTGSNLSRQMDEGKALKETELGSAAAAAIPQAALDVVSFKMLPGVRGIFGAAGKDVPAAVAKEFAEKGVAKIAGDYAMATGKAMGVEGLTEAAQQFFERMQAGLELTDAKARDEYWDSLVGGAVLGGALAPAGRYVERGSQISRMEADRRKEAAALEAQQREEARLAKEQEAAAAAQAEAERKADPAYAGQFVQEYETRLQEFKSIDAKKPGKDATFEDQEIYKENKAKKAELGKLLAEQTPEYMQLKKVAAQQAEQARLDEMSPEDFMLQSMGEGKDKSPKPTGGRLKGALGTTEVEEAPVDTTLADYANEQVQAARNVGLMDLGAYADYMMQNPAAAEQLVKARPAIKGLTRKESEAVYGGLNMRLKAGAKLNQKMGAAGTAAGQQRVGAVEAEEAATLEAQRAEEQRIAEEAAAQQADAVRKQNIAPEVAGIQRLGKVPEGSYGLGAIPEEGGPAAPVKTGSFAAANTDAAREKVASNKTTEALVGTLVNTLPQTTGKITPGQVYEGLFGRDTNMTQLQLQLDVARLTKNKDEARRIIDMMRDAKKIDAEGPQPKYREKMPAAGEGEFSIDRKKERDAHKFVQAQNYELMELIRLREGKGKLTTPSVREEKISAAKEGFVAAHAAEINARREVFGLPPMADWEKSEARARALQALGELDSRWGKFGAPVQAVAVLQQQTREAVQRSIAGAAERASRTQAPKEQPATHYYEDQEGNRIEGKQITAEKKGPRIAAPEQLTLTGEPRIPADEKKAAEHFIEMVLRSVERRTVAKPATTEKPAEKVGSLADIAELYADEKASGESAKTDEASVELLTQLREALKTSTDPEFISLAREQAMRIAEGNLPDSNAVRDLGEMMKAQEVAGRSETRPGATPEELQRTSAQPQKELFPEAAVQTQRATPSNFQKMLDSKNIQGMRDAIAKQKEDNRKALEAATKALPSLTKAVQAAEKRYENTLKKAQKAGPIAESELTEAREEIAAITEVLASLKAEKAQLEEKLAEIEAVREALLTEPEDMRLLISAPSMLAQEKPLRVKLQNVEDTLATANALEAAIKATQEANETLVKPLLKKAETADKEVAEARKEMEDLKTQQRDQARIDADAAEREKNSAEVEAAAKESQRREALQRGREGLNLPGIRMEKDTTKMRKRENQLRSAMGSLDEEIANADTPERKAEMQKRRNAAQREFDALYAAAPSRKTTLLTREELKQQQELDDAQAAAYDQAQAERRKKKGEIAPALKPAIKGPLAKEIRTNKITQEGKRTSVETAGIKVAEKIMQARADLADTQRRLAYLKDSGKDKVKGKLTPLVKELRATEKDQKDTLDNLRSMQSKVQASADATSEALASARKSAAPYKEDQRNILESGTDATEATSSVQTLLTEEGQDALADGRTLDVLRNIMATSDVPFIRENAEKLLAFVSRTRIMYSPDITVNGKAVPAAYNAEENAVGVRPGQESESNVIHELTHAATMRALEGPEDKLNADQLAAKREITGIYNKLKADGTLTGQYAAKNVKEFVSEVQSNGDLRKKLGSVKLFGSTALRKIADALMRLIGMKPSYVKTEEAQAVIERLYMQSGKLKNVEASPAAWGAKAPKYESENALTKLAGQVIAQPKSFKERFVNNAALKAEMESVDMRAGLREALKTGDTKNFQQAMYNVTKADQKMAVTYSALRNGAPELYMDDKGFHGIKSVQSKNNAINVFEAVSRVPGENEQAKMALATTYMIAQRAANKGLTKLDLGNLGVTQEQLDEAMDFVNSNKEYRDSLENVRERYNAYNAGLIKFLADTGAISKKMSDDFLKEGDYVPYYRVRDDGTAELVFGGEKTVTIGDVRHQPYLAELKGGDTKILPLNESLPRNTMLLIDKGLTNMATKNVAYALQDIGKGKGPLDEKTGEHKDLMPIHSGQNPGGPNVIVFNQEPDPKNPKDDGQRWLKVATDGTIMGGIPAELVVKSLEGAHLTLPAFLKLGGIAGDLLRTGVTRTPLYIMRQLIRDPMAATFTSGLEYGPLRAIYKATKEFVKMQSGNSTAAAKLIEKGLIQSNIFTGDPDDLSKFSLQLASGKDQGALDSLLAMADRAAISADAATRALVYENAIANGLSEVEADMMVMESMNFNKRGLSPTIQYASRLIPFFNAQIQGLNVLYKAARGQMPFEEQQRIKQKFFNNGMALMATGLIYAMAMQDDEYYKNAKPKDRYSNFFMYIPGVKEPLKIPIPYEAGWFFSAAVATVDAMVGEVDTKQQLTALKDMFLGSVPGYSSAGVPQLAKPAFEVWTNKNFFSGNNIESIGMQNKRTEDRYVASTTEMAKAMSRALPILSPVQIEHLVRGYLGIMPIAAMAAADELFAKDSAVAKPEGRLTDMPLIGSAFQKQYGGADVDVVYKLAQDAMQTNTSFNTLKKTGTPADVRAFREEHKAELRAAPMAGMFKQNMARLKLQEDLIINRMPLSPEEKRARLDKIDKARQETAERFMQRIKAIESQS